MKQKITFVLLVAVLLASCSSYKKIPYFRDIEENNSLQNTTLQYETRICAGDMITIVVSGLEPLAVAPFNLPFVGYANPSADNVPTNSSHQYYLVDQNGEITFPVLGQIKLAGLTKSEAIATLKQKLEPHLKNPIITMKFMNFKISVLGEVGNPGSFTIANERVTILEALALAGDMTVYGRRDNVLLIRETDGKKEFKRFNLNSSELLNSPYYCLQQNDVLYVEPNKAKLTSAANINTSLWLSGASTLLSAITVIVAILNMK